jgi:hypothetical protein
MNTRWIVWITILLLAGNIASVSNATETVTAFATISIDKNSWRDFINYVDEGGDLTQSQQLAATDVFRQSVAVSSKVSPDAVELANLKYLEMLFEAGLSQRFVQTFDNLPATQRKPLNDYHNEDIVFAGEPVKIDLAALRRTGGYR